MRACLVDVDSTIPKSYCRICNVELNDSNWYNSSQTRGDYICIPCHKIKVKRCKAKNPEQIKLRQQTNSLHTNGRTYTVRKRPKPADDKCELCKKRICKAYHHYGEIVKGKSIIGIWVCHRCHQFAELYDCGYVEKYKSLLEEMRCQYGELPPRDPSTQITLIQTAGGFE